MAIQRKSQRLNLRISPDEQDRLVNLQDISNAPSSTEVIRRALAVYEHLWKAKQNEVQVLLRDPDGKESDLFLL